MDPYRLTLRKWYRQGVFIPWPLSTCVSLVKEFYLLFKQNHINVIRMGLQTEDGFNNGHNILAGPYHPAFGHLVHSKIYLDAAIDLIKANHRNQRSIRIFVHPHAVSKMRGHMNDNTIIIESTFNTHKVQIISDPTLTESCIRLEETEPVCVYGYKPSVIDSINAVES